MMGIFSQIFPTAEIVKEGISMLSSGLDALVYTDEEKANDAKKERSEGRMMLIAWMKATQGQNIARRVIALAIVAIWLSQYALGTLLALISVWVVSPERWVASSKLIQSSADGMDKPVMLVLAFYFAAPYMGQMVGKIMNKWGDKKSGV